MRRILFTVLILALTSILAFAQTPPSTYNSAIQYVPNMRLNVGTDTLLITSYADNIMQLSYRPGGVDPEPTSVLASPLPHVIASNMTITGTSDAPIVTLIARQACVQMKTNPTTLILCGGARTPLLTESGTINGDGVTFTHPAGQSFYGVQSYADGPGAGIALPMGKPLSVSAGAQGHAGGPFIWTTAGYGLLWDSDGGSVTLTDTTLTISTAGTKTFELFFITGSPRDIIAGMTRITGRPPLFPKWSLGFMNTQWGSTQSEILNLTATYRKKDIPIDAFILDYDWFNYGGDNWGDFTWNSTNFPDGASGKFCKDLLAQGMKICTIRKPRLSGNTVQRKEAEADGFMYPGGDEFNFHTQAARDWWWQHSKPILDSGVAGYWNDEADNSSNFHFLEMQRTYYDGQRADDNTRVWSINRNFYLGSQRYAYATWSGDITTSFDSMANQRDYMLGAIDVGQPWWGMDIGGFQGHPSDENYARWMQFGAFVPVYRVHGTYGQKRQPWVYGPKAEAVAKRYIELRYHLLPYTYSCAWQTTTTGLSITRPLIYDYPNDPKAVNCTSEWSFGDWLLACPIVKQGATSSDVYLPAGTWIDYWTGERLEGGKTITRPLDAATWLDMPLYIKRGAIIPTAPPLQWVGQAPVDPLTVEAYPDATPSTFTLYDDDGATYDYEKGVYAAVPLACAAEPGRVTFTIGKQEGTYTSPTKTVLLNLHLLDRIAKGVTVDGVAAPKLATAADLAAASAGWTTTTGPDGPVVTVKLPFGAAKVVAETAAP